MLELDNFLEDNTIGIGLAKKYLLAVTAIIDLAAKHIMMLKY